MPRKSSYTREQIASRALQLIRDKGVEKLSARSLGAALGCSSSPIFTLYSGMDEVLGEVRKSANRVFSDHMAGIMDYERPFQEFSLRLMRFARKERHLFYFLFLQKQPVAQADLRPEAYECLEGLKKSYGLTNEQLDFMSRQMWTMTCGLTLLVAKQGQYYSEELVEDILSAQFLATMDFIKSGKKVTYDPSRPRKK